MATKIQVRRGTTAQWSSADPILSEGEIGYNTNTGQFKIGDGAAAFSALTYFTSGGDISSVLAGSGLSGGGTSGTVTLSVDTAVVATTNNTITMSNKTLSSPTISTIVNTGTLTLPTSTDTLIGRSTTDTLTNKTLTSPVISTIVNSGTLTLPTSTGTIALTSDIPSLSGYVTETGAQTLTNKILTSPLINGNGVVFEGTTVDEFETTLTVVDPTEDRTITLPNLNGTVILTTNKVTDLTAPTSDFSLNSNKIINLASPASSTDAATKQYVDDVAQGLHIHASCVTATTNNIDLSTGLEAGDVIDGVTLVAGDRVLVKNQSTTSQNGIYLAVTSGAAVRASDFDSSSEIQGGDFVFVTGGTSNDNTGWVQTEKVTTVGTDPIVFTQFSGAGTYQAGTGLTLTGNIFSINTGTTVDLSTAQTLTNKTISGDNNTLTVRLANDISGFAAGVATFLATPSSANLASAVTDETGSGALVFGTSPSFTTSITLNATAELRLADTDSSHYVGFKAPETVSTNRIWTLPSTDGTNGQTLSTDGSGTLSWSTPASGAAFSELMLIGA